LDLEINKVISFFYYEDFDFQEIFFTPFTLYIEKKRRRRKRWGAGKRRRERRL
jgi:hypothetical protein